MADIFRSHLDAASRDALMLSVANSDGGLFGCQRKSGDGVVGHFTFQPRKYVSGEVADAARCFIVIEKPRLTHDQKVPETADVIVHFAYLGINLIWRPCHHQAGIDHTFDRSLGGKIGMLIAKLTAQDTGEGLRRRVSWREGKM